MNNNDFIYKEAIGFLENNEFDKARSMLRKLKRHPSYLSQVNWLLGLIEAQLGDPYTALDYLEKVDEELMPKVKNMKQELSDKLPVYEQAFTKYNLGMQSILGENFTAALPYLEEAFELGRELPLSVYVYKAYLLSLIYQDKMDQAHKVFSNTPIHIQHAVELKVIYQLLQIGEKRVIEKKTGKIKRAFGRVSAAIIIAAVFLFVGRMLPLENDIADPAPDTFLPEEVEELKEKEATARQQLAEKIKQNESDVAKLAEVEAENIDLQELNLLVEAADINISELEDKASHTAYLQGFKKYRAADYVSAKIDLAYSLELRDTRYYSNDAMFFYIQTLDRLGEDIFPLMNDFLENEHETFIDSAYRDDIMLQLGEYHLENDEIEAGHSLLNQIIEAYPNEWTASKAKQLLQMVVDE